MTDIDLHDAMGVAKQAAKTAGSNLRRYYGNIEARNKGDGNALGGVFTELDLQTEQYLKSELGKFSNRIGFRGEEYGTQEAAELSWLVDPIDGTAHFIRGMPLCTIIIALVNGPDVLLSVIHDIAHNDTYWAIKGEGAYCNDRRISVSQRPLSEAIIAFETRLDKAQYLQKYAAVRKNIATIELLGSGIELAMIAAGKLDGKICLEPYGMDWDFAAGSLLVQEAGGVACNLGTDTFDYRNHDFIIGNPAVYNQLTEGVDAIFPLAQQPVVQD